MDVPNLALLVGVDALLFVFAFRRPFTGFVVLLAGLPLNGFLTRVVGSFIAPTEGAGIALAAWHDALLLGIVLAALQGLRSSGWRRLQLVEVLVGAVLALGIVYVVISPFTVTAVYVYRTLYEPPLLAAALIVMARARGIPRWLAPRSAVAVVGAGLVAALFAWPQVYVLGVRYLNLFYKAPGVPLDSSFIASGVAQPRAIGTFSSPNEFAAYLAICLGLLVIPRLVPLQGWIRAWIWVAVGLALLLTFSRSGWLSAAVTIAVGLWLSRRELPTLQELKAALGSRRTLLRYVPPVATAIVLAAAVTVNAGVPRYVQRTVGGAEPSAGNRIASVRGGLTVLREHPLGLGLGTAGPKAARFGEASSQPRILTETWYLLYAIQTGVGGLAVFSALVLSVLARLWRSRALPWARAAISIGFGLGAGAIFIPVIEDPAVFTPLWGIGGLALAVGLRQVFGSSRTALPRPRPVAGVSDAGPRDRPSSPVPALTHPDGPSGVGRTGDGPPAVAAPP